jgi:hypothetical protein
MPPAATAINSQTDAAQKMVDARHINLHADCAADTRLFFAVLLQTYGVAQLLEDIKGLYKTAGFKGQPVCFLFTDAEVKDEAFLEYVNQLLMTGEVAGEKHKYCTIYVVVARRIFWWAQHLTAAQQKCRFTE